ncbi:MAG: hypothetical protein JST00_11420 [Deltaproteobacteria bacterium]|nr:hypothetical protein [Deltaproteobacteria bacterium]
MLRSFHYATAATFVLATIASTERAAFAQPAPSGQTTPTTPPTTAPGTSSTGTPTTPPPGTGAAPGTTPAGGTTPGTDPAAPNGQPAPGATPGTGTLPPPAGTGGAPIDTAGTPGARAAGTPPPGVTGQGFMDTRLTWTFGDDDFLHKTGELIPLSPTFSVGERSQYRLFFDNLNSRFTGRENLTHLVMYKKLPGFIDKLTTEAALVLRMDIGQLAANTGNLNSAFYDTGSYLRLHYQTGATEREGVSAVFFPLDTDRFRLGYLYDLSWGGTAASINQSIFPRLQGAAPGLKIQYDHEKFYVFGGFKTATIIQPEQVLSPGGENDVETVRVGETNYGFLGGAGVDATDNLRFDAGFGYFQQGKFDLEDVRGKNVYTYGGSGRVVFHQDMPVPSSVDFLLYRNDPSKPMILFKPEKYDPNQFAYSISAELDWLQQHLKDFDVAGATRDQSARGAAVQGVVRAGYLRFSATGIYRELNFVVRNVPGFIPFETLPGSAKTDPELFGSIAADYHIPSAHLTPGIGGGVQLPATFRSEFTDGGVPAQRVIVIRQQGDESILPYNKERTAIVQARLSLRWDISDMFALVAWVQLVRDNNGTLVVRDPTEGTASLRVFQSPNRLGAAFAVQARF